MADSNQVRSERRRRHQRGDHDMCTSRCADRRAELRAGLDPLLAVADLDDDLAKYGPVTRACITALAALHFMTGPPDPETDVRWPTVVATAELAEQFDRLHEPRLWDAIARNLRHLGQEDGLEGEKVAEIRGRVARKEAAALISWALRQGPAGG